VAASVLKFKRESDDVTLPETELDVVGDEVSDDDDDESGIQCSFIAALSDGSDLQIVAGPFTNEKELTAGLKAVIQAEVNDAVARATAVSRMLMEEWISSGPTYYFIDLIMDGDLESMMVDEEIVEAHRTAFWRVVLNVGSA